MAKPFRSGLQPVEIGRRLTREMDLHRRVGVRGLIAPNAFAVTLSPADVGRFANFVDALSRELSDAAREHAKSRATPSSAPSRWRSSRDPRSKPAGSRSRPRSGRVRTAATWPSSSCRTVAGSPWATSRRHRPAARVRRRAGGLQRESAPRRVAPQRGRCLRHRPRLHQRHQGERHSRPGAAPGQRGRDQRRLDQAHLRNLVTPGGGVAVLLATQNLNAVLHDPAVERHRADLHLLPPGDPRRLGRDEPGHHPQAPLGTSPGAARYDVRGRRRAGRPKRRPPPPALSEGGAAARARRAHLRPRRRAHHRPLARAAVSP